MWHAALWVLPSTQKPSDSTLASESVLLQAAGLAETLADPNLMATIFAPTNAGQCEIESHLTKP
jgi:hypothetical protein